MKLELIEDLVVREFQNDFTIPVRTQENVYQRAVYYRICREFTNKSLKDIGYSIGRDHATVLHGIKIFKNFELWGEDRLLDSYAKIKNKVQKKNSIIVLRDSGQLIQGPIGYLTMKVGALFE